MNIRIIGNTEYCDTIESTFVSNSNVNIYSLEESVTFIKDDGTNLNVPNVDIIVMDGTNTSLCQSVREQNSGIPLCVAFLPNDTTWLNKEWKTIDADRFFLRNYPADYLIYKVHECYKQSIIS